MRRWTLGLAWLSVATAVIGFFLPWARIEVRQPKLPEGLGRMTVSVRRGADTIASDVRSLEEFSTQVSGFQLPQAANQEHAKVAIALMELVTQKRQHVGARSYAVYLLPGIALACGVLLTCAGHNPRVAAGIGIICVGMAGLGFWKLLTTETTTRLVAITFGYGLWLSLWAYVGLALSTGLCAVSSKRRAG